jgi:ADP-heptose:LPS heptosyltransferase
VNILHFSQALTKDNYFGGAELTEALWMKRGTELGHTIRSINASLSLISWSDEKVSSETNTISSLIDWADALLLSNISWFNIEMLLSTIEEAVRKDKYIVFQPNHFLPCKYIGLPNKTEELCGLKCGGLYSCKDSKHWQLCEYLIGHADLVIYVSPLLQKMYERAFGKIVFERPFIITPPPIDTELFHKPVNSDLGEGRGITVGGGTYQKGLENHILWANDHRSHNLDIYGKLEINPLKLPFNVNYCGPVEYKDLPAILQKYSVFVYHPKCEESYGRTVAEAEMCGLDLDVDRERLGCMSYPDAPHIHQRLAKDKDEFWNWFVIKKTKFSPEFKKPSVKKYILSKQIEKLGPVNSIIVTTTTGTGDVIMMLPMMKALRQLYPSAEIYHLEPGRASEVTELAFENDANFLTVKSLGLLPENLKFDLWIKPATACDNRWNEIGKERSKLFMMIENFDWNVHDTNRYMEYVEMLGYNRQVDSYKFVEKIPDNERSGIGLAIGYLKFSNWGKKHWGNENYADLYARLRMSGKPEDVYLLVGDDDSEDADEITRICKEKYSIDVETFKANTLKDYIAFISRLKLVVANDTSFGHLADSCNTPVISLFGTTNSNRAAPFDSLKNGLVIQAKEPSCSPCHKEQWNEHDSEMFKQACDSACMKSITVGVVYLKVVEFFLSKLELK